MVVANPAEWGTPTAPAGMLESSPSHSEFELWNDPSDGTNRPRAGKDRCWQPAARARGTRSGDGVGAGLRTCGGGADPGSRLRPGDSASGGSGCGLASTVAGAGAALSGRD